MKPGDDVVVMFDGEECKGEVISIHNGWVHCRILIDPLGDWFQGHHLSPVSLVMVRESAVTLLDESTKDL